MFVIAGVVEVPLLLVPLVLPFALQTLHAVMVKSQVPVLPSSVKAYEYPDEEPV